MKSVLFCLALAVTSAQAGLIVSTATTDVTAYGFGTSPAILTLQRITLEEGCVVPTDNVGGFSTSCGPVDFSNLAGSLVSGNDKYATPTLNALGVTSFSSLAILFNVNEPGSSQQVTLQNLMLTLYGGTNGTTALFSFGLNDAGGSGPTDLTNIAQGQGAAGFVIRIADGELPLDNLFDGTMRVGLSATIGCTLDTGCNNPLQFETGDGPESFTVANLVGGAPPQEVPEPATAALLGGGLIALAWTLRRRKAS